MIYTAIFFFALVTHVRSDGPSPSSPPPATPTTFVTGGRTCGHDKQLYQDDSCCGASPSKVPTTVVPYVPDFKTKFALSDAQETSCNLPVFCQCQFPVNKDAYLAAYKNADNGLLDFMMMDICTFNGVAFNTGGKLFSGSSLSQYALDGSKFDPTNASSVPRNLYVHEYFVSSEAAFTFWKWYGTSFGDYMLKKNGEVSLGAAALLGFDGTTRFVFSGMCKSYADELKAVFAANPVLSMFGSAIDFSLPAATMMARPSVPVEASLPIVDFSNAAAINANGLQPTGWTLPSNIM